MNREEYRDEIELIREQNDVEFEIYPLAAELISSTLNNLSKRYVFARKISDLGQIYYGISSFPDIAIVTRDFKNKDNYKIDFDNWNKLKGCIEVKSLDSSLFDLKKLKEYISSKDQLSNNQLKEVSQLIGEILWYKNVLYTNGVKWIFFHFPSHENYKEKILNLVKKRVNDKLDNYWWRDNDICNIFEKQITEEIITKDCIKDWDDFNMKIEKIDWINSKTFNF